MKNSKIMNKFLAVGLLAAELESLDHCVEMGFSIEDWLAVRRTELKGARLACANLIESEKESAEGDCENSALPPAQTIMEIAEEDQKQEIFELRMQVREIKRALSQGDTLAGYLARKEQSLARHLVSAEKHAVPLEDWNASSDDLPFSDAQL